jgi:hypothetical protein
MRADGPVVDVEERAEELLCKEMTMVSLMEVNTIGGEDACEISTCGVQEETRLGRVQRRQDLATCMLAWFAGKEILCDPYLASVDGVIEGKIRAIVGQEQADAKELHVGHCPVFVRVDSC